MHLSPSVQTEYLHDYELFKGMLYQRTEKEQTGIHCGQKKILKVTERISFDCLSYPVLHLNFKGKNDIQLSCLKHLYIMHTQKDKNSKFLNQDVLERKKKPYHQERDNTFVTIWPFLCQRLSLWSPEKKVVRAYMARECSICMH